MSSDEQPPHDKRSDSYRITALWSAQEGRSCSRCCSSALWSSLIRYLPRRWLQHLARYRRAVLLRLGAVRVGREVRTAGSGA
jgi:hypothetical protein